jgi:membrane protein required for colicin V production
MRCGKKRPVCRVGRSKPECKRCLVRRFGRRCISFAVVLILFEVVRGWRLGLLRQLVRVVALVAAYAAAIFGGTLLLRIVQPLLKLPDFILSILGGAVLALVVYALVTSFGMILFKRTGEQNSKRFRFVYGFAGAIVGLFFGAFILWMIVVSIRAIGAVADAQVRSQAGSFHVGRFGAPDALKVRQRSLSSSNEESATLATSLARLKNSLEIGSLGNAIKEMDPVPSSTYEILEKVSAVFSSAERAQKFLTFPGARELREHPKIIALRDDPEISEMIARGRYLDLLQNQRVIDAANDPVLANRLKQFELQRALDYAIEEK